MRSRAAGRLQLMRDFIEHCLRGTNHSTGNTGSPLDFIVFTRRATLVWSTVRSGWGISNQLRAIDNGFKIAASFPEMKGTPVIIGESDPRAVRHVR